jgi:hypothetical protein
VKPVKALDFISQLSLPQYSALMGEEPPQMLKSH